MQLAHHTDRGNAYVHTTWRVIAAALIDGLLEIVQQFLALFDPRLHLGLAIRTEPVPFHYSRKPAPNLFEVLSDLLRLLECVVLPEVFELDLLDELCFALLDDLRVFLVPQHSEAGDDLLLVASAQARDIEE